MPTDERAQAMAAYSAAVDHKTFVQKQTNDPGQIADAQRGVDAANQRYQAVLASQPKQPRLP